MSPPSPAPAVHGAEPPPLPEALEARRERRLATGFALAGLAVFLIAAVLDPEATKALYFVADGTGGHVFANTLAEHNANVVKWRAIRRARGEL